MISVLGYEDKNGQITDTLFDGVAFRPTTDWMYIYPEGGAQRRNTTKREWSSFLYNNIIQDGYNLSALEEAAGELKQTLNTPQYKAAVYLPLMITNDGFDGWGVINGVALNFTNKADRRASLEWLVDESIAAFNEKGFVNVELCGRTKENISGLKAYRKGGIDYGYMNGDFISWWISSDCKTVEYLRDSDDAYIRSTYDEMYKFIKKTLTEKEINTVMGD